MGAENSYKGKHQLPSVAQSGDVLVGRYHPVTIKLGKMLGQGGEARVFETTKSHAVKVFGSAEDSAETLTEVSPFREFEIQASFHDSPDLIVPVHFFDIAKNSGRYPFFVMDRGGKSIYESIRNGEISPSKILPFLMQSARALLAVHEAGFVHRDVKPQNFLEEGEKGVRLIDFGIAIHKDEKDPAPAGIITGTLSYLPPERYERRVSHLLGDEFAWGVMGYQLLTGKHPYFVSRPEGDILTVYETLMNTDLQPVAKHVNGNMTPWHEEIEPIIATAAAKDSQKRFQDFSKILGELEDAGVRAEVRIGKAVEHFDLKPHKTVDIFHQAKRPAIVEHKPEADTLPLQEPMLDEELV